MTSTNILSQLNSYQKAEILRQYDLLVKPENNGGHYLSPSQWRDTVNLILSQALNSPIYASTVVLNAVIKRIEAGHE